MFQTFPAHWKDAITKAIADAITILRDTDTRDGKLPQDGDPAVLVAVASDEQVMAAMAMHDSGGVESQLVVNLLTAVIQQQGGSIRLAKKDLAGVDGYRLDSKDDGTFVVLSAVSATPSKLVVAGHIPPLHR